jgi:hypothetical protein
MSAIVYRIYALLQQMLHHVPLGTNLGLLHLLFAMVSGRFLPARGAVFAALSDFGLPKEAVRRANAALCYGQWQTKTLLSNWQKSVLSEGEFTPHTYEGFRPVACDTTGFLRPHLSGHPGKHYVAEAGKALPAVVIGIAAAVGSVGHTRFALPRLLVRWEASDQSEATLQTRLVQHVKQTLENEEVAVFDAGFELADLLQTDLRFVVRLAKNATARHNRLPPYKGQGRPPEYGEVVRPLPRERAGKPIEATPPQNTARWTDGRHRLRADLWDDLVLPSAKPGATPFRIVAIYDPRYKEPLLLATNLPLSAYALWRLYRDRWAVEHLPLAAKPMLGCERAFVFGQESRYRLPELALLAGNLLSYVAATSQPVASGFWDRALRPTCGRLRRLLFGVHFSDLPLPDGQLRKKESVFSHLPKGVKAHRRTKTPIWLAIGRKVAAFTGN